MVKINPMRTTGCPVRYKGGRMPEKGNKYMTKETKKIKTLKIKNALSICWGASDPDLQLQPGNSQK